MLGDDSCEWEILRGSNVTNALLWECAQACVHMTCVLQQILAMYSAMEE